LDFVRGRAGEAVLADGFDGDPTREYAGDAGTLSFEDGLDGDGGIRDIIKSDQTNEMIQKMKLNVYNNIGHSLSPKLESLNKCFNKFYFGTIRQI
jgi:hypothetical protein